MASSTENVSQKDLDELKAKVEKLEHNSAPEPPKEDFMKSMMQAIESIKPKLVTAAAHTDALYHNIVNSAPVSYVKDEVVITPINAVKLRVDNFLLDKSMYLNQHWPYVSSLCRAHESKLMVTCGLGFGVPTAYITSKFIGRFWKIAFWSSVYNAGYMWAFCKIVQYKEGRDIPRK